MSLLPVRAQDPELARALRTAAPHLPPGLSRSRQVRELAIAGARGELPLHYDHDYDTLAEIMEFESAWLAPPGSIP